MIYECHAIHCRPIAIGASGASMIACVLIFTTYMVDLPNQPRPPPQEKLTFQSVFLAFGAILFAFGGASTFPTIQHDMKKPGDFPKAVVWAYASE